MPKPPPLLPGGGALSELADDSRFIELGWRATLTLEAERRPLPASMPPREPPWTVPPRMLGPSPLARECW